MRRVAGLIQVKQRLHQVTPDEQAFYDRAVQAQQQQRVRDRIAVIQQLKDRARREALEQQRFDEEKERIRMRAHQYNSKRRLKMYETNVFTLTLEQWLSIKARYKDRCAYCNKLKPLTKDHIVPISKGGFHTHMNVIPACQSCNSRKGARPAFRYKPKLIPF